MSKDVNSIRQMALEGKCCSQIILAMALKYKGEDNPEMLKGAHGLCGGMHMFKICGALSAAAFAFALFDQENAAKHMIPQLFEWYEESYKEQFGGESCLEITKGEAKAEVCLELVIETWKNIKFILEEYGFEDVNA